MRQLGPSRPLRTLPRWLRVEASDGDHAVTPLELFFDLVFVFAFTAVTAFMAHDLGWLSLGRGLVIIALLWWAWCSYAWLGNQARADEGVVRAAMVLALAIMFGVALVIPEAWEDRGGGLSAPLLVAAGLSAVRLLHLGVYLIAAGTDTGLRRQLLRTAVPVVIAATLLIIGALLGGTAQTVCWLAALVIDYGGIYATGTDWRLPSAAHFAERHGLMIIIALGESLVAIGVGLNDEPVTAAVLGVAGCGLIISLALWWAYFDVVAPVAERVLAARSGTERVRLARDSFTYLHFPMVTGIIFLALGLKKATEYVGDTAHHHLGDPLPLPALVAGYGGVVLYLSAHLAFRLRNIGTLNRARLITVVALVVAAALVARTPALVALAVLAAVVTVLIGYETVRYAGARSAIRHGQVAEAGRVETPEGGPGSDH